MDELLSPGVVTQQPFTQVERGRMVCAHCEHRYNGPKDTASGWTRVQFKKASVHICGACLPQGTDDEARALIPMFCVESLRLDEDPAPVNTVVEAPVNTVVEAPVNTVVEAILAPPGKESIGGKFPSRSQRT